MKKRIFTYLGMLFLAFAGVAASAATTPTETEGVYETDKGIQITINDPGKQAYTGITPDDPQSGYNVYTQQNADVGVKVTYDAATDETTYLYGYNMYLPRNNRYGYWSFDLGNNKITKNDEFNFYVLNTDTQQEYLVDDMENKDPSSFSIYIRNQDYGTGGCMPKTYQLKIVVKGNKTTTMNGIDIIEELSGENACFGDMDGYGESPCRIPTSNTVYDYFYYTFDTDDNEDPIATTAQEKWEEYISKYGYDNPYNEQGAANDYLMRDILGNYQDSFNHEGHLYKHRINCSYFLYTKQNANYPDVYVNGIFEQGLLSNYFSSSDVTYGKEEGKACGIGDASLKYDYATYLKNGHTSQIEYYTLSLKYTYKVHTPKNFEEISFRGYMDRVANQIGEYIDKAYENGVHSCDELIASLNQQITTLNNTVASKNKEISSLQNQLNQKNDQITSLKSQLEEKNKELAALDKELTAYEDQVDVLTKQIKEKELELSDLKKDTSAKAEEISSLNKSIATLTALNDTAKDQLQKAEEKKKELDAEIKGLNQKITSLQSDADAKQNNINILNKEVQDLKKEIEEKKSEVSTLERVIGFKDDKISELEKEKEDNKFFSTNGYWKKLFNFKDAEHWNVYNWLTWIGLGLVLVIALVVFVKKKK